MAGTTSLVVGPKENGDYQEVGLKIPGQRRHRPKPLIATTLITRSLTAVNQNYGARVSRRELWIR